MDISTKDNAMKKETIEVFGMKVKVEFLPVVIWEGKEVAGLFIPYEKRILVSCENRTKKEIAHSYLHELFHCVIYRLGIHNAHLSHDLEEIIVDNFSGVLSELFDFEII